MGNYNAELEALVVQSYDQHGRQAGEDTSLDLLAIEALEPIYGPENRNPITGKILRGVKVPPPRPRPPPEKRHPPGRCTLERRNQLQDRVRQFCDAGACGKDVTTCRQIAAGARLSQSCIAARRQINDECYGGGDRAHKGAVRDAIAALNNCRDLWRQRGCEDWDRERRRRGKHSLAMFE
jgi:hypothetical protein